MRTRFALLTASLLCSTSVALAAPQAGLSPVSISDYSYHPSTGDQGAAPEDVPADFRRREVFTVLLRAGAYGGSGAAQPICEGAGCPSMGEGEGFDEQSAAIATVEWLFATSRSFRFGTGITLLPKITTQMNGQRYEVGTALGGDFIAEGVIDVSKKTALTLRASAGISVLAPSGDLKRDSEALSDLCGEVADCTADPGPYLGVQGALGAGVLYDLGQVGARVDFQVQGYSYRTLETEGGGVTTWVRFAGVRPMLLAGIEL